MSNTQTNTISSTKARTQRMVSLAVLAAIVIILAVAVAIPLGPLTITLTMVPIIIGAILYGPAGGAFLGLVFGIVVTIQVITGAAGAFSTELLTLNPAATILVVLLKGTAAGFLAGIFFKVFGKFNFYLGVVMAAIIAPITNTGIFSIACLTIFRSLVVSMLGSDTGVFMAFITAFVGVNFLVEFTINVALTPVVVRIIRIVKKS